MTSAGPGLQAALIAFSLRFRGVVIALAALVIAAGAYSLGHATYDVFPEFAPPQAVIHTGAPGLSPDQVEVLVTQPLENALTGAPGLASLRSSSIQGLSIITANFDPASDVLRDRQVVSERLASSVGLLPRQAQAPSLTPSLRRPARCWCGLDLVSCLADGPAHQRRMADQPTLMAVPGVAKVAISAADALAAGPGEPGPAGSAELRTERRDGGGCSPAGVRGAGFIDSANQRLELKNRISAARGRRFETGRARLRLHSVRDAGDVATVLFAPEPARAAPRSTVGPACNSWCRSSTVPARSRSRAGSRSRWTGCGPCWPATASSWTPRCFVRPTSSIWRRQRMVGAAARAALVVAVLVLFMADCAMPPSRAPLSRCRCWHAEAAAGFRRQREHDDAGRAGGCDRRGGRRCGDRRREHPEADARQPAAGAASQHGERDPGRLPGSAQRGGLRDFAVVLVVLPIVSLSGVAGRLFAPLGYAYALAIIASLLVSLTVIRRFRRCCSGRTDARRGAAGAALVPYPLRTDAGAGHPDPWPVMRPRCC